MRLETFARRKVLVTGATGLIGSHFVDELIRLGARVRGAINRRPHPRREGVEIVQGDLRDPIACRNAVEGAQDVIHAAAVSGGSKSVERRPIAMFTHNLLMNTQLLEAARCAGVERYLLISNSSVYPPHDGWLTEDLAWGPTTAGMPENHTGMVKRTAEVQCQVYARVTGMRIAIVRGGNAYGPHDDFDLETSHVIPALIRKAIERQKPYAVWGTGETVRDFTHARDIARGGLFLLERHAVCDPVNIATGVTTSIRHVAEHIVRLAGYHDAELRFTGEGPPASSAKRVDVAKMRRLGFVPQVTLEQGLVETIDWYREHIQPGGTNGRRAPAGDPQQA